MAQGKKYLPNGTDKEIVERLRTEGCTIAQIVEKLGICYDTFLLHRDTFQDALKKGDAYKDINDLTKVKNKLLDRCLGEKVIEKEYTVNENGEQVLKSIKEKTVVSDMLIVFYLANKSDGEFVSINQNKLTINPSEFNLPNIIING